MNDVHDIERFDGESPAPIPTAPPNKVTFKEVSRMAVVSTAYITRQDRKKLIYSTWAFMIPGTTMQCVNRFASMFYTPMNEACLKARVKDLQGHGMSENFIRIITEAFWANIAYVVFDADGGDVQGLDPVDD